jgi:hypothetical protein
VRRHRHRVASGADARAIAPQGRKLQIPGRGTCINVGAQGSSREDASLTRRAAQGLPPAFDEEYPEELQGVLSQQAFKEALDRINDAIIAFFPCFLCRTCAVGLCVCTLGLSCFCPFWCITDAKYNVEQAVEAVNGRLKREGIRARFRFESSCIRSTLWVDELESEESALRQ